MQNREHSTSVSLSNRTISYTLFETQIKAESFKFNTLYLMYEIGVQYLQWCVPISRKNAKNVDYSLGEVHPCIKEGAQNKVQYSNRQEKTFQNWGLRKNFHSSNREGLSSKKGEYENVYRIPIRGGRIPHKRGKCPTRTEHYYFKEVRNSARNGS